MLKSAYFDATGAYRYLLHREWDAHRPFVTFVMLNPSTADGHHDDPTIRKCIKIAQHNGFGALKVVNLYAYKATDPRHLQQAPDAVGPYNDQTIITNTCNNVTVAAWGNHADPQRALHVWQIIPSRPVFCVGVNQSGQPQHPLYAKVADLKPWAPPA